MRVAIVGAGMAGLTVAGILRRAGMAVHVFDKGRGPGGRMSTRRAEIDGETVTFDHGAQYLSPKSESFRGEVQRWVEAGVAAPWSGKQVLIAGTQITEREAKTVYVGTPGMNGIIRHLASHVDVEWGRRVKTVAKEGHWTLAFEDGTHEAGFDMVNIAVPAEQVADLLSEQGTEIADAANAIISDPCWTVMAAFENRIEVDWDGAVLTGHPVAWAARNGSKPDRGAAETWVLQASADWSRRHLEDPADVIAAKLTESFARLTGAPAPVHATAHRWRYSQVQATAPQPYYLDASLGLAACGDWCVGRNVEDAWTSGWELGHAILDEAK